MSHHHPIHDRRRGGLRFVHHLLIAGAAQLTAGLLPAQTTGLAGLNDYTVNTLTAGSTSCTSVCVPVNSTMTLNVDTRPGNLVLFFIASCPCAAPTICWPPNACTNSTGTGIPFSACTGTTNQSVDIVPGCIVFTAVGFADPLGQATLLVPIPNIVLPLCSVPFSTQALVIDPCGVGGTPPGPFVLTQAYDLLIG